MNMKNSMIFFLIFSLVFALPSEGQDQRKTNIELNADSPIVIDGNGELGNDTGFVSGSGNVSSPYILSFNLSGDGSGVMMTIKNTNKYFTINGSSFSGGTWGVRFENVTHGKIENSTISGNSYGGIWFEDVTYSEITRNQIAHNTYLGINLVESNNNLISDNNIESHYGGPVKMARGSEISMDQWSKGGGAKDDPSSNNVFQNNVFKDNADYGLLGLGSENMTIQKNTFGNNSRGVVLDSVKKALIDSNTIENHTEYGIFIDNSFSVTITETNTYKSNEINLLEIPVAISIETLPGETVESTKTITVEGFFSFSPLIFTLIFMIVLRYRKKNQRLK